MFSSNVVSRLVNLSQSSVLCRISREISNVSQKQVGIFGVPFDKGQRKSGVSLGPKAIRDGGLVAEIKEFNELVDIKDYGDIKVQSISNLTPTPKNMINYSELAGTMKNVSEKVKEILNDKRMCITLGGDHSIAFGSIDGHLKYNKDIVVVWIDAHADLNTNTTSPTGNLHGMPVALLAKELENYWPTLPGLENFHSAISLQNFVYIGLRAVDPLEKLILSKYNMHVYGMEKIDEHGIVKVVEMALKDVDPNNKKGIHMSFDIDSLDSLEAPSTGTAVRGGLSLREGVYIVEEINKTGRLEAVDLVEVNPTIGSLSDVKKTVDAAIHVLKAACGTVRSGNIPLKIDDIPKS